MALIPIPNKPINNPIMPSDICLNLKQTASNTNDSKCGFKYVKISLCNTMVITNYVRTCVFIIYEASNQLGSTRHSLIENVIDNFHLPQENLAIHTHFINKKFVLKLML